MNARTSAGSVQIMVLGCRCQVTEPKAVRRISSPVERPNRLSTKSREDQPSACPRDLRHGVEVLGPVGRRQQDATGPQHAANSAAARRGSGTWYSMWFATTKSNVSVLEGQVLRVAGTGFGQLDPGQPGDRAGGRLDHAFRQIGQGEPEVGEQRRALGHSSPVPQPTSSTSPPSGQST